MDIQAEYDVLELPKKWTCGVCTFENDEFHPQCNMCGSPQPAQASQPAADSAGAAKKPSHFRHVSLSSEQIRLRLSRVMGLCHENALETRAKLQNLGRREAADEVNTKPYFQFAMQRPSFWLPQLVFSQDALAEAEGAAGQPGGLLEELERYERGLEAYIRDRLVDTQAQAWLEQTRALNRASPHFGSSLTAFRSAQGSNNLLHALCLAMWGVHDSSEQLRRCLLLALEFPMCEELTKRLETLPGNSAPPTWSDIVAAVRDNGELSPMHVMVMTYVLRRPIVIFGPRTIPGTGPGTVQSNPWRGIYMPDMLDHDCGKDECTINFNRNPLFLAWVPALRTKEDGGVEAVAGPGRFVPLLWTEGSNPDPALVPMFDLDDQDQPELLPVRFPPTGVHPHTLIVRYFRTQTSPTSLLHVRFHLHANSKAHVDLLWRNHVIAAKAAFEKETGLRPPEGLNALSETLGVLALDDDDEGKEAAPDADDEKESEAASLGGGGYSLSDNAMAMAMLQAMAAQNAGGKYQRLNNGQAWNPNDGYGEE